MSCLSFCQNLATNILSANYTNWHKLKRVLCENSCQFVAFTKFLRVFSKMSSSYD